MLFLVLVATGCRCWRAAAAASACSRARRVGFLLAWPVAAYVVGWLSERAGSTYKLHLGIVANLVGGIVVVYAGGIVGMAAVLGLSLPAATVATWIYVPGDAVKVVIAALVARGVHAAYPGLLSRRPHRAGEGSLGCLSRPPTSPRRPTRSRPSGQHTPPASRPARDLRLPGDDHAGSCGAPRRGSPPSTTSAGSRG